MVMSKIGKAVAAKITSGLDNLDVAMFGGQLEKASFFVYEDVKLTKRRSDLDVEFFLNPNTIQVTKEVQVKDIPANQQTPEKKFSMTYPVCLKLSEMWFDTYDTREDVRGKYVSKIEKLLDYAKATHHLPVVVFNWGTFQNGADIKTDYKFFVTKMTVDYTLFLPDATPVRAKVDMSLEQVKPAEDQVKDNPKESPDHAKLYTVKRGDTLQGIAKAEYDDPREWRRIAKSNNINDPMDLRPGLKLLVPPILK